MAGDPLNLHLRQLGEHRTLCGLDPDRTQFCETMEDFKAVDPLNGMKMCQLCQGISLPPDKYRRVDFRYPDSGVYVTAYQRPGEEPRLDLNFFDGDYKIDLAVPRVELLVDAHELATAWHLQTSKGRPAAP